jgi:hypothetical protein
MEVPRASPVGLHLRKTIWRFFMKEKRCSNCRMRLYYDRKPGSIISKIWKWHITWCPGWKSYLESLPANEKKEIIKKYS